jgi:IMP cyclohydrolase
MYIGRFVVVGPEIAAYRVSSRSFPNRKIIDRDSALTVTPTEDAPETDNPYISYNCSRTTANSAVVGNGSHVDPITEKLELGYPARDALAESLLALDYEKDDYDTPRIAGVLANEAKESSPNASDGVVGEGSAYVGIVRRDALLIREVTEPTLVATYEKDSPEAFAFDAETAGEAASGVFELDFEHSVCAAGVARTDEGFEFAVENGSGN